MKIMLADDEISGRQVLADFLEVQLGHQVTQCSDGREALKTFQNTPFPMVLADICMPGMSGINLLQRLKAMRQGKMSDIILITGHGELNTAIEALRGGAYDYLLKPVNLEELTAIVNRIAEHQALIKDNYELTHRFDEKVAEATQETKTMLVHIQQAYAEIVGTGKFGVFSDGMRQVVAMAERLHEDRSVPVLIEGETGTGKEIIARLVHYGPGDVTTPFVSINCSAIASNLFESELFGYEGGAFTGAKKTGQMGKLELARGGTLLLDEIGDMPLELQPKLLRVLQEREFYRVGGVKKLGLDARIIFSTNRDLERLVKQGAFRRDLFFRLNIGRIYIPPLRERTEAIGPMAQMFLEQFARRKNRGFINIHKDALKILYNYSWPGNVRELQNTIERIVLLYDETTVEPEHLKFLDSDTEGVLLPQSVKDKAGPFTISLPPDGFDLKAAEAKIVRRALSMFDGNKTRTAAYFGISRNALRRKLDKGYRATRP